MNALLFAEAHKLKRLRIIYIGVIGIVIAVIISAIQINAMREGEIHFTDFSNMVFWNSVTMAIPFCLALIGGYIISREYEEDTRKNLEVIPVCWSKIIISKILILLMIDIFLSAIESLIIYFMGVAIKSHGMIFNNIIGMIVAVFSVNILILNGVLPIILFFARKSRQYIWGALLAMLLGIIGIFISNGKLVNIYPVTYGYSFISFEMVNPEILDIRISIVSMMVYLFLSYIVFLIFYQKNYNNKN